MMKILFAATLVLLPLLTMGQGGFVNNKYVGMDPEIIGMLANMDREDDDVPATDISDIFSIFYKEFLKR